MKRSLLALGIAAVTATSLLGGCVVADPVPARVAVATYVPYYYYGYPVYYDAWGAPIFYVDGVVHYVPRSYPRYGLLVSHYRAAPYVGRYPYRQYYRHGRG